METEIETFADLTEYQKQDLGGRLVDREVIHCASYLVMDHLQRDENCELSHLAGSDDYWTPAEYHISNDMDYQAKVDYLYEEDVHDDAYTREDISSVLLTHLMDCEQLQEFCNDNGIDPQFDDVLEHWIVSPWLLGKLEEKGQVTESDFFGFSIWGRYCSGQAIASDNVIQEIAFEAYGTLKVK